jgi:uncharacterized protein DUF3302
MAAGSRARPRATNIHRYHPISFVKTATEGAAVRARRERACAIAAHVPALWIATVGTAHASFLSGETLDTAADVLSWIILVVVPIVVIAVFWMVHVLPEKIAHKRHHPQTKAIQVLCLLSLVFGGLLWPIAWLWAYTKPVAYKVAYGTEKHEDYFAEIGEKVRSGQALPEEILAAEHELEAMRARGPLPPHMEKLREDIAAMRASAQAAKAEQAALELDRRRA